MANNFQITRPFKVIIPKIDAMKIRRELAANDLRNKIRNNNKKSSQQVINCNEELVKECLTDAEATIGNKNVSEEVENQLNICMELTEEERLLADTDELSVFSETINEEELLDDKNEYDIDNNDKNMKESDFKLSDNLLHADNSISGRNNSAYEDDMFETLSLAASEFNDELEPKSKQQMSKSLISPLSPQSSEEKVTSWKKKLEIKNVPNSKFKIPKQSGSKFKKFAKPLPVTKIKRLCGEIPFVQTSIKGFDNTRKPESNKICYNFVNFGYCNNKNRTCHYQHSKKSMEQQRQEKIGSLLQDVPAIEDYKKLKEQLSPDLTQMDSSLSKDNDFCNVSTRNSKSSGSPQSAFPPPLMEYTINPTFQPPTENNLMPPLHQQNNGGHMPPSHMQHNGPPQNHMPLPHQNNRQPLNRMPPPHNHMPPPHQQNNGHPICMLPKHQQNNIGPPPNRMPPTHQDRNGKPNYMPPPRMQHLPPLHQHNNGPSPNCMPHQQNIKAPQKSTLSPHSLNSGPPSNRMQSQHMQNSGQPPSHIPPPNSHIDEHHQNRLLPHGQSNRGLVARSQVKPNDSHDTNSATNKKQHKFNRQFHADLKNKSIKNSDSNRNDSDTNQKSNKTSPIGNFRQNNINEQFDQNLTPSAKMLNRSLKDVDAKEKFTFEDLHSMLNDPGNDIESSRNIIKAMNAVVRSGKQMEMFRKAIELTLLKIHTHNVWNLNCVEIAQDLLSIKSTHNSVRSEDLFILAECESRGHYYHEVIKILTDMKARQFEIKGINEDTRDEDCAKLFYNSVERKGMILQFWKELRDYAIRSHQAMEKLLSEVQPDILEKHLQEQDIRELLKYFVEKEEFKQICNNAKTTFLSLLATALPNIANVFELFDFLEIHIDCIKSIPKKIVRITLSQSRYIPDIMKPFNVLKGMLYTVPSDIWYEFSKLWNDLLIYCCRRGDDSNSIQIAEQYYGVMQQCKIVPTVECAIMMLSGLVKTCYFEVFETHYQNFLKMKVFPTDFRYPDHFAQDVSDNIERYTRDDKNCLHYMVSILLSSNYPPPEPSINEVLNMLVSKRRFSDVYKLVTKCFDCSIILSQHELRKVVYALEEWMQNVDASVKIYQKMREKYPRPEHQCVCGGNVKPQNITSRVSSFGELASPKSSTSSHEVGDLELLQLSVKSDGFDKDVVKIAAELSTLRTVISTTVSRRVYSSLGIERVKEQKNNNDNFYAASDNVVVFADVFEKAYEKKVPSHDKILAGLFLGITGNKEPFSFFHEFAIDLFIRHSEDTKEIEKALGRVGVRLISFFYNQLNFTEATSTVEFLHQYCITYANCGAPFGTQLETREVLSTFHMAEMCCQCCLKNEKPALANSVFQHFKELLRDDKKQTGSLVTSLVQHLLHTLPSEAFDLLMEYHENIKKDLVETFLNSAVLNLERERMVGKLTEAEIFFRKYPYNMFKESLKTFVNVYGKSHQTEDARKLYRQGLLLEFYQETFVDPIYHVEIPIKLRSTEIYFAIELHIVQLCNHPYYGVSGKEFGKNVLHIVVVPGLHEDVGGDEHAHEVSVTMKKISHTITQEFSPPLQILGSQQQKYTVSPKSLKDWFEHKNNGVISSSSTSTITRKRKRQIEDQDDNLLMTICPTPVNSFHDNKNTDNAVSEQETVVINTQDVGDKRILKQTNNPKEAKKCIVKIIDIILKELYLKNGRLQPTKFRDTWSNLRDSYLKKMKGECGRFFYDEDVCRDIEMFIEDYFTERNE